MNNKENAWFFKGQRLSSNTDSMYITEINYSDLYVGLPVEIPTQSQKEAVQEESKGKPK